MQMNIPMISSSGSSTPVPVPFGVSEQGNDEGVRAEDLKVTSTVDCEYRTSPVGEADLMRFESKRELRGHSGGGSGADHPASNLPELKSHRISDLGTKCPTGKVP